MVIADGDTHSMLNISTKYVKYMFHHQLLDGERGLSIRGLSERGKTRKPEAIDKSDCSLKFKYLVLWYLVLVLHSRRLIYRSRSIRLTFPPVSRAHKRAPPTIPVPLLFTTATAYVCARARVYVSCLPPLTSIVNIFSVFFFSFPLFFPVRKTWGEKCARSNEINEDARKDRPFSLVILVWPVEVGFLFRLTRSELFACYAKAKTKG